MTLPVKITASTVPIPSPMICLVNTSPMIPDIQKQVTSKTFLPIPMPLPSLSPIVAASASAGSVSYTHLDVYKRQHDIHVNG